MPKRPSIKKRRSAKHFAHYCKNCRDTRTFAIDKVNVLLDEAPPEEYTFAHCETCDSVSFFIRENVGDGFESDDYYRVYSPQYRHIGYYLLPVVTNFL